MNWMGQVEPFAMSRLAEIQETIRELQPEERTALRDWLNGYEGNALIFLNPSDSSYQLWPDR
jgi:hypothetical protein